MVACLLFIGLVPSHGWVLPLAWSGHRKRAWAEGRGGNNDVTSVPGASSDDAPFNISGVARAGESATMDTFGANNTTGKQITSGSPTRRSVGVKIAGALAWRPKWKRAPHGLRFVLLATALRMHCASSGGCQPPSSVRSAGPESVPAARLAETDSAGAVAQATRDGPRTLHVERRAPRLPGLPTLPAALTKAVVKVRRRLG
jgi:hypothetical protein